MSEIKTSRPFQQRFLNGFDRSELRQEVQSVKPKRLGGLRKKYATWALGASLALGGLGAPMKMIHDAQSGDSATRGAAAQNRAPGDSPTPDSPADQGIANDLKAAQNIASEVAGGVQAVTSGVKQ